MGAKESNKPVKYSLGFVWIYPRNETDGCLASAKPQVCC